MGKKKTGIDKQVGRGQIKTEVVSDPTPKAGRGRGSIKIGSYDTNDWTTKKYVFVVLLISIPYFAMLFALYSAGLTVLVAILLGLTILCALLVSIAYWVDKADF